MGHGMMLGTGAGARFAAHVQGRALGARKLAFCHDAARCRAAKKKKGTPSKVGIRARTAGVCFRRRRVPPAVSREQ